MESTERTILHKITFSCFSLFIISSGISITFSQGMLILTLLLWLYGCFSKVSDFQYNRTGLEKYIVVFIVVSIILALLSPSKIENLLYLKDFWLISAFIIASSLLKTKEDILKVFYLFLIVSVIQSLAAYIQYFADINYMNAVKYGAGHWRSRLPMGKIVMGFLGHHLTFGGYMMMISIPLFYLSFLKKRDVDKIPGYVIKGSAVMVFITTILSWARSIHCAAIFNFSAYH